MARHGADGANRQAVVAPQHDRQVLQFKLGMDGVVQAPVPGNDLVEVAIAGHRGLPGVGGAAEIASVQYVQAMGLQGLAESGHAQGFGSHGRATGTSTDVGGHADQGRHSGRLWVMGRRTHGWAPGHQTHKGAEARVLDSTIL